MRTKILCRLFKGLGDPCPLPDPCDMIEALSLSSSFLILQSVLFSDFIHFVAKPTFDGVSDEITDNGPKPPLAHGVDLAIACSRAPIRVERGIAPFGGVAMRDVAAVVVSCANGRFRIISKRGDYQRNQKRMSFGRSAEGRILIASDSNDDQRHTSLPGVPLLMRRETLTETSPIQVETP
ncbi:MAG: hypothetical protein AAFS07_16765 [Pseudomonadota bacterium]